MLRSFPQLTPELMAEAIHYYEAHQAEIDAEIHAELRADEHAENCKRRHRTRAGRNSEREEVPLVSLIIPRPCYLRKASSGPRLAALLSPRRRAKTPWPSRQMEPAAMVARVSSLEGSPHMAKATVTSKTTAPASA